MTVAGEVIAIVLSAFLALMFVRFVIGLVLMFARSWSPKGVALVGIEAVYTVTDPPIRAIRRFVPPLDLGGVRLDLAFILVIVIATVLQQVNEAVLL